MPITSQYPHFWQDKEGKSHRNMLQIEADEPKMQNNYPKDGTITIRLQDEQAQKAFKMTPQETLMLGEELKSIAKDMLKKKRELWEKKGFAPKEPE
jgi:tRNA(Leu) C34 or U34 (ribose-2'-O)-methylase TrmL